MIRFALATAASMLLAVVLYAAGGITSPTAALAGCSPATTAEDNGECTGPNPSTHTEYEDAEEGEDIGHQVPDSGDDGAPEGSPD